MKSSRNRFAGMLFWLCWGVPALADDGLTDFEARGAVAIYVDALVQGDLFAIKGMLGAEFLAQRQVILDSTAYADLLTRQYANATTQIVGSQRMTNDQVAVDVDIRLTADETLQSRFVVGRNDSGVAKILEERAR